MAVLLLQKAMCFIVWLVAMPLFSGIIPSYLLYRKKKNITTIYLCGVIFMFAVFQLLAVPLIIKIAYFSTLINLYTYVMAFFAVMGILVIIIDIGRYSVENTIAIPKFDKKMSLEWITWIVFFAIVIFQMIMSIRMMTPDGDDAYYLGQALIADKKDWMYIFDAYTGSLTEPNYRHALAPFPMFIALLARKSEIHPTIVAHSILPVFLIFVTYLIFYRVGNALFEGRKNRTSIFMVLMACFQMFGSGSIYTSERFFLTRTWQGKSCLANIIIPAAFCLLLQLARVTEKEKGVFFNTNGGKSKGNAGNSNEAVNDYGADDARKMLKEQGMSVKGIITMLVLVNIAGALMSSLGVLLLAFLEILFVIVIAIRNRKLWLLFAGMIPLIPCIAYAGIYFIMNYIR